PDSPAIDAGANPDGLGTDQRGFAPRSVGRGTDIGAVEFGAARSAEVRADPPSAPPPVPAPRPLSTRLVKGRGRRRLDIFDAGTGTRLAQRFPFGMGYRGRVSVLTADSNADGVADLIVLASINGRVRTRVYSGTDLSVLA